MWQHTYLLFEAGLFMLALKADEVDEVEDVEEDASPEPGLDLPLVDLCRALGGRESSAAMPGSPTLIKFIGQDVRWLVDVVHGITNVEGDDLLPVPARLYKSEQFAGRAFLYEGRLAFVVNQRLTSWCLDGQSDANPPSVDRRSPAFVGHSPSLGGRRPGIIDELHHGDMLAVQTLSGERIVVPLAQTERFIMSSSFFLAPAARPAVRGVILEGGELLPITDPYDMRQRFWGQGDEEQLFLVVSSRGEPVALPLAQAGYMVSVDAAQLDEDGHLQWRGQEYFLAGVDNW